MYQTTVVKDSKTLYHSSRNSLPSMEDKCIIGMHCSKRHNDTHKHTRVCCLDLWLEIKSEKRRAFAGEKFELNLKNE